MMKKHTGSCICGQVRYEATLDPSKGTQCNCTFCTKLGTTGSIIKPDAFTLLVDKSKVAMYSRHPDVSQRYFCPTCGTHVYGAGDIPEIGGAFVSIYLNTLDDIDLRDVAVAHWDGRNDNWQAGMAAERWPVKSRRGGDANPGGASA